MARKQPLVPLIRRTLSPSIKFPSHNRTTLPQTSEQRRPLTAPYGYTQAKSLIYTHHGDPASVLDLHTHSLPPAHGPLLTVRLLAAPVNPADINAIQGVYPSKPPFSTDLSTKEPAAVPGSEGVAEVLSAGKDVRVASPTAEDPDRTAGVTKGDWLIMRRPGVGTWRTHVQAPGDNFLKLDGADRAGVTAVQAATVSVNPCTAHALLRGYVGAGEERAAQPLRAGEWFAQNAANSSVGRAAIQLGSAWGLKSVNVVRARPEGPDATAALKRELQGLGADVVVTEEEAEAKGFAGLLRERHGVNASRASRCRLALNAVGGRSALNLAKVLSAGVGGMHVTYGAMGRQGLSVPAGMLIFSDVRFVGFWVSEWARRRPGEKMAAVRDVFELGRRGEFGEGRWHECGWEWGTGVERLREVVGGGLEGFRGGKGVFVFGET